jgi:hypothetical protein
MNLSHHHRILISLVLLLLFITGCSADTVSPTLMPYVTPEDNPTAGAVVRRTRQAQATLTQQALSDEATLQAATQAAAQATQVAEAHTNATATAAARATAQAIMAEKTAWPLVLHETFADNQSGWPLGVKQDHSLAVTSTIESGRYHWVVKVDNGNSYFNLVPPSTPNLTDFAAVVNVQFDPVHDDGHSAYGLTFRHVKDDYGFFGIKASGEWLALEVHHTGIYQSKGGHSPMIDTRPGHTNRLEVVARGSDYVFLINGQQVGMMSAEINPGQIGLGVDAARRADTAEVEFTELEVHTPSQ